MPRMLQDKYRNCCKFLAFFCKLVRIFLAIFLHFNFSYKNGFAFFCIIFAFFCTLIFGGPFFSCIFFAFFLQNMFFFTVFQKEAAARPHKLRSELAKENPETMLTSIVDRPGLDPKQFVSIGPDTWEGKIYSLVKKAASWIVQFGDVWLAQMFSQNMATLSIAVYMAETLVTVGTSVDQYSYRFHLARLPVTSVRTQPTRTRRC